MKKRSDGRWQKSVLLPNGKRKMFYSTASTQKQAEADIMRKVMTFKDVEEKGLLFSNVAEKWEEEHIPKLAVSTAESYQSLINFAKTYFDGIYIKDIMPINIKQFMQKKIKLGYSAKRVAHQMSVLGMILKYACVEGYIEENPAQYIAIPKGLPKTPRKIPNKTDIEIVQSFTDTQFGLLAFTILYLGLRKGEALALELQDINFDENIVCINKAVSFKGNKPFVKSTKSTAGDRFVVLPQILKEKFQEQKNGLLFPGKYGYMTHSEFHTGWIEYQKLTGLKITAHQLRHAYASYILHDSKIDVKTAQYLMGHADVSTTQNIYTQITERALSDAQTLITNHIISQKVVNASETH